MPRKSRVPFDVVSSKSKAKPLGLFEVSNLATVESPKHEKLHTRKTDSPGVVIFFFRAEVSKSRALTLASIIPNSIYHNTSVGPPSFVQHTKMHRQRLRDECSRDFATVKYS